MEQHKVEFSLIHFLKYALRYVLVAVLCAAIGLGLGAVFAAKQEPVYLKKYTGSLRIDARDYYRYVYSGTADSEGEYLFCTREIAQVLETAKAHEVSTKTFAAHKDALYGSLQSEAERVDAFNGDLVVTLTTDALYVSFTHHAETDEQRALAMSVVNTYLENAKANVLEKHPALDPNVNAVLQVSGAPVLNLTAAYEDVVFSSSVAQMSEGPSILLYAAIGAVVGAILGAGLLFALYLFDPRIKTITAIFPAEYTAVVDADNAEGVASFAALLASKNAKCVMLASPRKDDALCSFGEALGDYLVAAGKSISVTKLTAGSPYWMHCFDKAEGEPESDVQILLCEALELGVLSFVAEKTDAAALFIHRGNVHEAQFRKNANAMTGCNYLGTVMHGKSAAYLD